MLAGYCWPQSALAGETLDLAVSSSSATCSVEVARIGADEVVVLRIDDLAVAEQAIPPGVEAEGCGWSPTLNITVDASWQTGFYLVRLRSSSGEEAEAFFVVRATDPGDTLLVLSTSTWAAYNDWGGPSFYTGSHVSSQQRPLPRGFLDKPEPEKYRVARFGQMARADVTYYFDNFSYWSAAAGWANWERLFVRWAEVNGLQVDYATSLDLANDPELLTPYKLYLSVGHDEYWSASMRDSVEGWVEGGGSAVFFSGNTAFWQVRFEEPEHRVVGYKMDFELDPVMGTDAQHSVSTMWSDPLCERPENEMTGVTFTRGGYAHCHAAPMGTGGYTVWRPDHWAFEGLSLYAGDIVGAEPVVVGYECDGCELALVDGLPVPTGADGTPTNFEVLGSAPARLWETADIPEALGPSYVGEVNWVAQRLGGSDTVANRSRFAHGAAVMGAFTRGNGHVFTTGCTDWAYGLGDPAVSRITRNVVSRFVDLEGDE